MKLKKVTALLLATSMVLSSVSVTSFADEVFFEDENIVAEENSGDEVSFDDVTEDVTEDESLDNFAFVEEDFVEDEAAVDEVFEDTSAEEVVNEDIAASEEIVDNSDIYEALEGADETITEDTAAEDNAYDNIDGNMSVRVVYDGTAHGLDLSGVGDRKIQFRHKNLETGTVTDETAMAWYDESPTFKHVSVNPVDYRVWSESTKTWEYFIYNTAKEEEQASWKAVIEIVSAPVTVTLNNKTVKTGDNVSKLAFSDYTFTGLASGESAADRFEFTINVEVLDVLAGSWLYGFDVSKWNGSAWSDPSDAIAIGMVTTGETKLKYATPGKYLLDASVAVFKEIKVEAEGQNNDDYVLTFVAGEYTVTEAAKKEITVRWPEDLKYDSTVTSQTYEPTLAGYWFAPEDGTTNKAKNVGKYTYTIGKVYTNADRTVDVTDQVVVTNPTHEWAITKAVVYAIVNTERNDLDEFEYGTKDPAVLYTAQDVVFYDTEDVTATGAKKKTDVAATGTPVFESTYNQYDPVFDFSGVSAVEAKYFVRYKSGLESKNYEIKTAKDNATATEVSNEFTLTPAEVRVIPNNVTVAYGEAYVEPTFTLADVNKDSKAAAALQHDIDEKKVVLSVFTVSSVSSFKKVTPKEKNTYYYKSTLEDAVKGSHAATNFYTTPHTYADGVTKEYVETKDDRKYIVVDGKLNLTFADYEGVYDGKPHGIVVTPQPIPSEVTIYYSNTEIKTLTDAKANGQTDPITYSDPVNKKSVYYFVDSTNMGSGLNGYNTVTIISKDEEAAKKVEKQIEEAVKKDSSGNYDAAKVKAAREAYDALTPDQKKLVDPYDVKALQAAEAAVKEQDAKAAQDVIDQIAALPAADKVTEADRAAIEAARKAYDALTPEAKAMVPAASVAKLEADEKALDDEDADKKAAKAVEDQIDALPAAADATAATKPAADAAKAAYDALTDAQKALVPADKVQKLNDVKAAADKAAEEEEKAKKEVEAFDQAVAAVKAAKNGVDGKAAAEKAKEAYDNLSPAAKALLTDEEVAAYEATQKAYKKDNTFESGEGVFRVLSNGELTYVRPLHPENTWFVVPNQVKKRGFMYKVVKVSDKAFFGCNKATKVKIGKNVQTMGKYAFKNTPAMAKLIFLTSKLTAGKVTNSFVAGGKEKGAKLTVVVPNGKTATYEPLFKGEGGMNAKAKFTEQD